MTDANGTAATSTPPAPGAAGTATPGAGQQDQGTEQGQPGAAGEKILGFIGAGIGALLLGIGIDLMTGGALSRMLGLGPVDDDDQPG